MPFHIVRNDIVNMKTDAIVNTTNYSPTYGDGVDTAIHKAAGPELMEWRKKYGLIYSGQAVKSPPFNMDCKMIIHVVGPVWRGGFHNEALMLAKSYREALALAEKEGCKSISFPLISSGSYLFPKGLALSIATSEIQKFLYTSDMTVYLVVYDKKTFTLSRQVTDNITSYIDNNYVDEHFEKYRPNEFEIMERHPEVHGSDSSLSYENVLKQIREAFSKNTPRLSRRYKDRFPTGQRKQFYEGLESQAAETITDCNFYSEPSILTNEENFASPCIEKSVCSADAAIDINELEASKEPTFQQMLFKHIDNSGLKDSDVYKQANIDRRHFSKIRSNVNYQPNKNTAIAFCLALKLNLNDALDLLKSAGYSLSMSNIFDLIIRYCIENKIYNIMIVNEILFEYCDKTLSNVA